MPSNPLAAEAPRAAPGMGCAPRAPLRARGRANGADDALGTSARCGCRSRSTLKAPTSARRSSCIRRAASSAAIHWRLRSMPARARTRSSPRPALRSGTGRRDRCAHSTTALRLAAGAVDRVAAAGGDPVRWRARGNRLAHRLRARSAVHRLGRDLPRAYRIGRALRVGLAAPVARASLRWRARVLRARGDRRRVARAPIRCSPGRRARIWHVHRRRHARAGSPAGGVPRRRVANEAAARSRACRKCSSDATGATPAHAARTYFATLWRLLRPLVAGREAVLPRIFST